MIETNIDDTSGEVLGYTMDRLFEKGALDVFYTPIYMKKNRPAIKLSVLCHKKDIDSIANVIFCETSTIGVRVMKTDRITMDRKIQIVDTEYGQIRIKKSKRGDISKYSPEFEDCKTVAEKLGLPLREVYDLVLKKHQEH